MAKHYFSGRLGPYLFCDICGQPCYISESRKLSRDTGRGGLIVCPNDRDVIDASTIPYKLPEEKAVPWTRINHTTLTNGAAIIDIETTNIGV